MKIPVLAISIWMFIGMTVLGVFGYIYVLWNQYWRLTLEKHQMLIRNFRKSSYSREIAGKEIPLRHFPHMPHIAKHFENSSSLVTSRYNLSKVPTDKLMSKINTYKNQLIVQLRKSQLDAGNVIFDKKDKNRYNVNFKGQRPLSYKTAKALVCEAKKVIKIEMLTQNTEPFKSLGFGRLFPSQPINKVLGKFQTCAIVSSAGSMYKSKLGKEIDAHDAVLRFNSAPTEGFEDDVGTKTTIRILNSQVVSKPEFDFFQSPLYRNVTMIAWDPSKYHGNLTYWYKNPDFDLFTSYWIRRKMYPDESFYILNPEVQWIAWDYIQKNTPGHVEPNPPSSGFLGKYICYLTFT
ncbi:beta-galactoside alpha-2,6-sialyltransferase 2-like [Centruroides sculpturatus]|uniref:beta-galactoside alpha-2,6-sialyltransferase 2-like n=1 Tax=Centruroides sculpturatus TaxID=218467 RepID=UPI000C6EDDB2|nr:beta-galactoside alpha-2,6-sialyltransferase 2-like [Centruroides sculpturatus]XP_023237507.1 beta-galactoside alpha-2,6-sialyltransferase 2-like [Centruroides sculpturatus]XP_023237508.1 beta-galactoside alpha-2,6-sialyltransferase 2-like [Centruroides sculpturatus]